jgi:hypothetical protein
MKIIHNNTPFFHITLKDVFSSEELKIIFKEIIELKQYFKSPNLTGSASRGNNYHHEVLKKNTGTFLLKTNEETYKNLKVINIIDDRIKEIGLNNNWNNFAFKRLFDSLIWGSELINCYKKNDYYRPHFDYGIFTLIFFLWEDNSTFNGGDLFFPEYDYLYECNSNHGILFFSKELHEVTPLISKDESVTRYSIATFSIQEENNKDNPERNINKSNLFLYQ